jgi:hypothetical protein
LLIGHFWQHKLSDNKDIEFPDRLCKAIAEITHGFSFAYIQEAFVAALLAIARDGNGALLDYELAGGDEIEIEIEDGWVGVTEPEGGDDDDLNGLVLWTEIKKQVSILREGMEEKRSRFRPL